MHSLSTVEISKYLQTTGNRDRVMATLTFVPMVLGKISPAPLAESLGRLSALCDGYRTITRLGGLFDVLQPANIAATLATPHPVIRALDILETLCAIGFFPSEHISLFTKHHILFNGNVDIMNHYGSLSIFFWFWGLVFKIGVQALLLVSRRNRLENSARSASAGGAGVLSAKEHQILTEQVREHQLKLVNSIAYVIFAMTCVSGKTRFFYGPTTNCITGSINALFEAVSPPQLAMATWLRGVLGMVANSVEYVL